MYSLVEVKSRRGIRSKNEDHVIHRRSHSYCNGTSAFELCENPADGVYRGLLSPTASHVSLGEVDLSQLSLPRLTEIRRFHVFDMYKIKKKKKKIYFNLSNLLIKAIDIREKKIFYALKTFRSR